MIDSPAGAMRVAKPRGRRRIRFLRNLLLAAMLAAVMIAAAGGATLAVVMHLPPYQDLSSAEFSQAVEQVTLDIIGENPHLIANPPQGVLPLCNGVSDASIKPFRIAFGLMRSTPEGLRLFDAVVEHGVCVDVDEIA